MICQLAIKKTKCISYKILSLPLQTRESKKYAVHEHVMKMHLIALKKDKLHTKSPQIVIEIKLPELQLSLPIPANQFLTLLYLCVCV